MLDRISPRRPPFRSSDGILALSQVPLPTLVAIMLTRMRMSIQAELDTFFAQLRQQVLAPTPN